MSKIKVGDIVYCDITTHAARRCLVISKRRWVYLLKPLDRLHDDNGVLIKKTKGDLWVIPDETLLATPPNKKEDK